MPIDASIPLQVRPPQQVNPLADIAQIMQLKQAQALLPLKIQEAQQQAQTNALELQEKQRAISDRQKYNAAYAASIVPNPTTGVPTTDRKKLSDAMIAAGIADKIPAAMEGLDKIDKSANDLVEQKNKIRDANIEYAAGLGAAIRANNNNPDFYRHQIQTSLANGDTTQENAQKLLAQLDQLDQQDPTGKLSTEFTKQHADAMMAPSEKMTTAQTGVANAATTARRLDLEAPKIVADTKIAQQNAAGTAPIQPAQQATIDISKQNAARVARHEGVIEQQGAARLGIAQQRLAQSTGGIPLTPLQQSIADKLASGDFNPAQLTRFPDKEALISGAIAKNPNWSPQTYATKKAFEDPQSKQSQNLGTISRIVGHIGRFEKNSKELGVSPSFFAGVNMTGKAAATQADAHAISAELEKLVSGGVGTEGQVQTWQKSLTSSNPEIRQQAVDEISQLIGSQYEGMNQTYKTTIGSDLPIGKYVSPAGRQWMKTKGIDTGGSDSSATGGQGKITVTAPDGSTHPFETQAQADAFKKLAHIP